MDILSNNGMNTLLRTAVVNNNLEDVKHLVFTYNYDDQILNNMLWHLIGFHCNEIAKFLFQQIQFIDLNTLIRTASAGNLEILQLIDKHTINHNKQELFVVAFRNNHLEYIKYLHSNFGIDFNDTKAVTGASKRGFTEILQYLINNEAYCSSFDLEEAVFNEHIDIVKILIDRVVVTDLAIYTAFKRRNFDIIKILLTKYDFNKLLRKYKTIVRKNITIIKHVFVVDFHLKRETVFSQSTITDINIIQIVYDFL